MKNMTLRTPIVKKKGSACVALADEQRQTQLQHQYNDLSHPAILIYGRPISQFFVFTFPMFSITLYHPQLFDTNERSALDTNERMRNTSKKGTAKFVDGVREYGCELYCNAPKRHQPTGNRKNVKREKIEPK